MRAALEARARLLARTRAFFERRSVLEVDTPLLCAAGAVDAHLEPIAVPGAAETRYLPTSPEHSMKRLLAAGSGPIFQIAHAFRSGERGRLHNPEFTILEWYRPGFDHHRLMDEVEELMRELFAPDGREAEAGGALPAARFERMTYRAAFERALGLDPHSASLDALAAAARRAGREPPASLSVRDRDAWLHFLLATCVEPTLAGEVPTFVVDYPKSQAALARLRPDDPSVAERFELYVRGIEIANGYHELADAAEQERRFVAANRERRAARKSELPIDERLLVALRCGLPPCAGVAVGFDRVVMLAMGATSIDEVLAFPYERA